MSRLILAALADHANKNGLVYVSSRTLADELGISSNTVFVAYRLYENEGILQRTGKKVGRGGTIQFRMEVNHLPPQNARFVPLPEPKNSSTKTVQKQSTNFLYIDGLSDPKYAESSDLGSVTPTVTPTDAPIRERSGRGSRSGNRNKDDRSRAADVEGLINDEEQLDGELQDLFEQVFDIYADFKRKSYTGDIRNEKTWREGVKKNALKEISPRGDTYRDRAITLLNQGYRPKDIAGFLADGCVNGQGIVFWDKRPGFIAEGNTSEGFPSLLEEESSEFPF